MGIIFKNTLSNVLANKRRTVLLIICMTVVAFSAMTAFSISDAIGAVLDDFVSQTYGNAQVEVNNDNVNIKPLDLPENAYGMYTYNTRIHTQRHSAENFAYATKSEYTLIGGDIEQMQKERYLLYGEPLTLGDNELIITEQLAKAENWEVGSTVDVMTNDGEELTLTVKYVLKNERFLKDQNAAAVSNAALVEKIESREGHWTSCYVFGDDIAPNRLIDELSAKYAGMTFVNLRIAADSMGMVRVMFTAIFLILTLIIFIVTSGISEHIIRERMSQMGTLRSIGATRSMTSAALISENLFYSIPGAVIGVIAFIPFGKFFMTDFFISSGIENVEFHAKPLYILFVFIITAAVSCLSSVKAVVKAIKTPIRDIIFGGRDSAYVLKKGKAYAGLAMIVLGIVCGLFIHNVFVILLGLVLFTAGSIFFMPLLLRIVCGIFKKSENPVIRFAFNNIATKKTVISSAVLFAVVIGLVSAVFMETDYITNNVNSLPMTGDIVLNYMTKDADNYRFIGALDGVEKTELHYYRFEPFKINDNRSVDFSYIIGYDPGNTMFRGVKGIEGELAMDEASLDTRLMNAYKINEGDMMNVTFNVNGERPIELRLKAAKGCDTSNIDFDRTSLVINAELYKKYFLNKPQAMTVKLDDPSKTDEVIGLIKTYLMDKAALVNSYDEYVELSASGNGGIQALLYIIIATGCLLSVIMLSTNLTIGFEQRKKELAVLHSTSMSKAQLRKLLFSETALSLTISAVYALISGTLSYLMIVSFVAAISSVPPGMPDNLYLAFVIPAIMLCAALITAAVSRDRVNKMNTANEMKYE